MLPDSVFLPAHPQLIPAEGVAASLANIDLREERDWLSLDVGLFVVVVPHLRKNTFILSSLSMIFTTWILLY